MSKLFFLAAGGWTEGKNGTFARHNNLGIPLIDCQLLLHVYPHIPWKVYFCQNFMPGARVPWYYILLHWLSTDAAMASKGRLESPISLLKSARRALCEAKLSSKLLSLRAQQQSSWGLPWAQGFAPWPCKTHNHCCHFVSLPLLFVCNAVCNFHVSDFKHFM